MSKKENVLVTINNAALAQLLGVKEGDKVAVECKNGTPTDRYWRNRFRDAKLDKAITLPNNEKKTKAPAQADAVNSDK